MNKLSIALIVGLLFYPLSAGAVAFAENEVCLYDSAGTKAADMPNCAVVANPRCGDQITRVSDAAGVRLNPTIGKTPVDKHGICRFLDNNGGLDLFVPMNTKMEWMSFLNNGPSEAKAAHCARPFNGQSWASGLYFGKTSALFSMGDTGDAVTADVHLPYWRTGIAWPESASCEGIKHTFRNRCYEEYVSPKCWKWVRKVCTGNRCTGTPPKCTPYTYDCSYCANSGSICSKNWYEWTETFDFHAQALDSDIANPSWSGRSTRIGGATRPSQCMTRCKFDGHDCTCPLPPCTPTGVTTCTNGKKYDSCGKEIGTCPVCCPYWGCG